VRREFAKWRKVVTDGNVKVDEGGSPRGAQARLAPGGAEAGADLGGPEVEAHRA